MCQTASNGMSDPVTNSTGKNNRLHNGCLNQDKSSGESKYLRQVLLTVWFLLVLMRTVNSSSPRYHLSSEDSNTNSIHKNCTKCSLLLEDAKMRRLEELKRDFLHKLGLKEAPKIAVDKFLYNIPPLDSIFSHTSRTPSSDMMLGDQPFTFGGDEVPNESQNDLDDSTGSIKKVISFAKLRE